MSFLKVDTDRVAKRGSVFVAMVGANVVVGKSRSTSKVAAVMAVAAGHAKGGYLPEIRLLKFKKTNDSYRDEVMLHSMLYKYRGKPVDCYKVQPDDLEDIWSKI